MSHVRSYDPNHLLDAVMNKMKLSNDAALGRLLEIQAPVISKIRNNRIVLSSAVLLRIHEVTGLSVRTLQDMMGDRRLKYRLSPAQGRAALGTEP